MKRKFYIAAHNPNTVKDAIAALKKGANALAPDVHYDEEQNEFYVYHLIKDDEATTLKKYLKGLSTRLLKQPALAPAFIIFDVKPPYNYNLSLLYEQIRRHFSAVWPQTGIITTINDGEELSFLLAVKNNQRINEAVGIDEYTTATEAHTFLNAQGLHYVYGNGTSVPLSPTTKFADDIAEAIQLRNSGNSFKMVYAWTVNSESSMRTYLDMEVDGLITDDVEQLKNLLLAEYADKYELATPVINPFIT